MKKLDWYIIKKFLGTFFFSISLIILIVIVFDISEKIDEFLGNKAPFKEIIFVYYFNFIPYFVNLFSALFTFIAVIYFTSRLASNTEIISMLSSGISFKRIMFPYMVAALFLAVFSLFITNVVIPPANAKRIGFEERYIKKKTKSKGRNVHLQISKGDFVYVESFNIRNNKGKRFTHEVLNGSGMSYKLSADKILWDTTDQKWILEDVYIRTIDGMDETITRFERLDTSYGFTPKKFEINMRNMETMSYKRLSEYIRSERNIGSETVVFYEVEKQRRIANPFSTIVLTLIGLSISTRKMRGGIGMHIGIGLLLAFTYILFMKVSETFATYGDLSPIIAVWIPNFIYASLAVVLIRFAPK